MDYEEKAREALEAAAREATADRVPVTTEHQVNAIAAAIKEAVEEERAACAKVAASYMGVDQIAALDGKGE